MSTTKAAIDVRIKKSKIDGKGLFAYSTIDARRKLGEIEGVVITIAKARKIAEQNKRIAIVELDDKYALNATDTEAKFKYINHSCQPNTYMRIFRHHVEFYALRTIHSGEELTCNYGETHHDGKLPCKCGAPGCKGFL